MYCAVINVDLPLTYMLGKEKYYTMNKGFVDAIDTDFLCSGTFWLEPAKPVTT